VSAEDLRQAIRDVPDFPKEGILFKDITTLLQDPTLYREAIDVFLERYRDQKIDKIAAIDARGFLFGSALAYELNAGLVPIRKKGKLPYKTIDVSYELEYGTAEVAVHIDAIKAGERVLLIDDLLATGGTAQASVELIRKLEGDLVEAAFLIELGFLNGRAKLGDVPVFSQMTF
jgi:adenine phosphoribosyltransferase